MSCGLPLGADCATCGAAVPADARFCMSCGTLLPALPAEDAARRERLAAAAPARLAEKMRQSAMAGERKIVTVLFVDVVGSTGLAETLDPEEWKAIMNGAFESLAAAVYRYEGTIAQFLGDGFLAFFGAPVAHEDDPVRAVHAALDVIAAATAYATTLLPRGVDFAVRVGLNTGLVVVGAVGTDLKYEYLAMGDAVNLAARMQTAAPPMGVLVTESTRRFVAPFFDCRDMGTLSLKNHLAPVRAFLIERARTLPGTDRGLGDLRSEMVGRAAELAALRDVAAATRTGVGRVVALIGDAGLGKSRLLVEWRSSIDERSMRWAQGNCATYGAGIPYHLLANLIRSLLGVSAAASDRELRAALIRESAEMNGAGPEAVSLLAHLLQIAPDDADARHVTNLPPQALQAQYVASLRRLLESFTRRGPIVVVLNDVHWADPSSIDAIAKLLPMSMGAGILFCFATRPDREAAGWRLVTSARDLLGPGLREIALAPLHDDDARRMVGNLLDTTSLPPRVAALVQAKAEGNPLFVEEIIRALIDSGALVREGDRWIESADVREADLPGNLHGLLIGRIDRLPDAARRTVRVASVIGREFPMALLSDVVRRAGWAVPEPTDLARLESAGLIRLSATEPEPRYSFHHALVQDAAYLSLLKEDRRRLHLATAEALEAAEPDRTDELASILGHHYERAEVSAKAIHHLTRAADRAKATFANEEALALYRAAIAQLTTAVAHPPGLAAALQEGTGEVLLRVARTDDSVAAFQAALDHVPPEDRLGRARLFRKAGAALHIGRRHSEAFAAYDSALESLGTPPDPDADAEWWHEWIDIKLARCYLHYFRMELAPQAAILEEVGAVIARHGTAQRRALYHRARALMALRRDRFTASDAAIADARAASAAWNGSGDPTDRETVHFTLGFLHLWRSELADAERWLGVSAAAGERAGDIVLLSRCWTYLTIVSRRRGDEEATLDYARRALAHARAGGMVEYIAVGEANLAWLSWRHGELDELRAHAEASLGAFAQIPVRYPVEWVVRLPLMAAALDTGDILDAATQARELVDPTQQFLGADLERALAGAVAAADARDLGSAGARLADVVRLMRTSGHL